MRFSPILKIAAARQNVSCIVGAAFLVFLSLGTSHRLAAQSESEEINRFTACLPEAPPAPDLNVPTLCDEYGDIDETNADVVIGENVNSITYSSTVKDPNGPIGVLGWSNQTLVIYGTLIVDDETWFSGCVVRMMPGSKIQVSTSSFLAILSKFFACNQMWEGIRFYQYAGGSIWGCHIEDANLAINIPANVQLNVVENRFNRNQVGMAVSSLVPLFGTISLGYFWGNTFTITSNLNAYYSGQTPVLSNTAGIMIRSAAIDLTSQYANAPNKFINLDYGIHSAFGFFTVGNAEFIGQTHEGIWANRGTIFIKESAPCLFRDNFYSGITASELWQFEVSGCTFDVDEEQYHGIMLDGGGLIQKNTFNLNGNHFYAIRAERNGINLDIVNNSIFINTAGDGIRVDNVTGSGQGVCTIAHNTLDINVNGSPFNIGIHVVGGTGDNYRIIDNDLDIRKDVSDEDIIGILFEQCSGVGHVVSQNRVYSSDDEKGAYNAIYIKNVQNGVYCLNETDDTYEGMLFYGNNNPSRIEQNSMYYHNYSLIVDGDPAIGAPAVVGPQFRAANYWEPNGYKLLAAVNTGDPTLSLFTIHDPSIEFFPPSFFVNPPGWFVGNYGTPELECEPPMASTNPLDDVVADGSFFDSTSTPLLEWEMNRYLFYKMLRNTNYGQGNNDYASFYSAIQNTNAGAFAQVDRALYLAGAVPLGLAADWEAYNAQCDTLQVLIQQLSASATPPTSADDDVSAYVNAKTALLDSLNTSSQAMASAWETHETNVAGALQSVRTLNDGISTVYVFETNQKVLNELKIKAALGESWTNGDLTALQTIASQSPDSAGTTVWQAIAMLPRCYEASRSIEREQGFTNPLLENVLNSIRVYPNPTSDIVKLEFPQAFTGTVALCDAFGKIVAKQEVNQSQLERLDVSRLAGGVYFLTVSEKDGVIYSQIVIVNR